MTQKARTSLHSIANVGLYLSGKTALLVESLLFVTEAISRKGSVKDGNTQLVRVLYKRESVK